MHLYSNATKNCINTAENPNPPLRSITDSKTRCFKLNGDEIYWEIEYSKLSVTPRIHAYNKNANYTGTADGDDGGCSGGHIGSVQVFKRCLETGNTGNPKEKGLYYMAVEVPVKG